MMLVISGDVHSSEVLNEVARVYMKAPGAEAKSAPVSPGGPQGEFRYRMARGSVPVPNLFFGFRAPPESDADYRALQVVASVLGMGENSVLPFRLRDRKKIILSAETTLESYPGFGFLSIGVETSPDNIDRAEIAVLTEIELLKREELTDAEMERALAQLERAHWGGLETVSQRGEALARFESLGDWKRMDRYVSDLRKVKAPDVKRAAAKYLRLENCSVLEYLPAGMEERTLTDEGLRRTFESLLDASADEEQPKRDQETQLAVKIPPPAAFKFSEIRYPFQTASVLRGPELYIREDHTSPLIEMGLYFPGGKLNEKEDNAGITMLMSRLMLKGGEDVSQFYRQFEIYGGTVHPVVEDDYFGFRVAALSQNFEEALKLLLEVIRAPNFDKEEVALQKEIQRVDLLSRKNTDAYAKNLVNRGLFGAFPYSLDSHGTEAGIDAATPESLQAWYDALVKNRKPVVAIVGDTRGSSLATVFVQRFSGSRFQATKIPEDFARPLETAQSAEHSWSRNESLILIGFQAPPEDDEDGQTVAVIQGYAGDPGRLSHELRDGRGIAHDVSVQYDPRVRGGSLIIAAATAPGSEEGVVKALREEIQKMRTGPIPYRDFRSGLNEASGWYAIRQQVRSAQIGNVVEQVIAGKGIGGYRTWADILNEVDEEDLGPVIQRILNMDRAVVVQMRGTK
jgi:zinc protease